MKVCRSVAPSSLLWVPPILSSPFLVTQLKSPPQITSISSGKSMSIIFLKNCTLTAP
ncbi:hypothetical protein PF005_g17126 [Phytophthora fragariae]|uniref:Uncharacterized protein n=2 Tax=Phytophthora TaxID=4783 RepID=A0A6A3EFI4_9STRA|nr:hypothetical protein PF003_g30105 [Phytophthora fragariae]KAE9009462.1 hypothetical protein PR002_g15611 [Phytophthora rubi]KAE8932385.1 hypothetical protein PF009_g17582 [Phytophthora fragariae]KAE8998242.1 hypothetical protein PF011_g15135 [Phytophthora fragariae]KAE9014829.1 hypothetical protein PR001_g15040 [Phytophthora rubi]